MNNISQDLEQVLNNDNNDNDNDNTDDEIVVVNEVQEQHNEEA